MYDICGAFVNYYTNPSINATNDGRSRTISATKSSPLMASGRSLQIARLFSRVPMMRDGLLCASLIWRELRAIERGDVYKKISPHLRRGARHYERGDALESTDRATMDGPDLAPYRPLQPALSAMPTRVT